MLGLFPHLFLENNKALVFYQYYVLSLNLSALHGFLHLLPRAICGYYYYYYSQLRDEETDEQREEEPFARGRRVSSKYWGWDERPGSLNSSTHPQPLPSLPHSHQYKALCGSS